MNNQIDWSFTLSFSTEKWSVRLKDELLRAEWMWERKACGSLVRLVLPFYETTHILNKVEEK
jgi:hypothetical protein